MSKSTKTNGKANADVIELDAEEVPLEKIIDKALQKNNVTEMVIAGLKEKYGGLKLRDIDNKEDYLEICEARKDVRKYGILAEKICKAGREDAIKIQKLWLRKQDEVLGKIAEVQDPLDAEIDKYEKEVERKETEAANRREEAYMKRQQQLLRMGATYDNGSFVLNHISYETTLAKESDDDIWTETILPKYQKEYEKNESARVAEEKKREEEALALKQQQEEMNKQRQELERQQLEFKKAQEDLQRQQSEAEQQRLAAQRKLDEEAIVKKDAIRNHRVNELAALGMTYNFSQSTYLFQDVNVHVTEITTKTDEEWAKLIDEITPIIEDHKADLEVKRLEEIKQREKEAGERAVAEEKEKQRLLAEKIELERKRAEAQQAEELAKASDKTKWEYFIKQIQGVVIPEFKSAVYKNKMQSVVNKVREIVNL